VAASLPLRDGLRINEIAPDQGPYAPLTTLLVPETLPSDCGSKYLGRVGKRSECLTWRAVSPGQPQCDHLRRPLRGP
jgi:hypothetical protein